MRSAVYYELAGGICSWPSCLDSSADIVSSNPDCSAAISCCLFAGFPGTPDRFAVCDAARQPFLLFGRQGRSSSSAFYFDEEKMFRNGHMALLPFFTTFDRVNNRRR